MRQLEHNLQAACVKWFRLQYPRLKKNLFAVPNGAWMPPSVSSKMKAEGMTSGVADLALMISGPLGPMLWIEMKAGRGVQSQHQKDFQCAAINEGHAYRVCRSFDEFRRLIETQLKVIK